MPADAVTSSRPGESSRTGSGMSDRSTPATAVRTRSTAPTTAASSSPSTAKASTNSSPPTRYSPAPGPASEPATAAVMAAPTRTSTSSPTTWPNRSLTSLKWSRSTMASASREPARAWSVMASVNARRFSMPVSGSTRAWRRSCSEVRRHESRSRSTSSRRSRAALTAAVEWTCMSRLAVTAVT